MKTIKLRLWVENKKTPPLEVSVSYTGIDEGDITEIERQVLHSLLEKLVQDLNLKTLMEEK